MPSPIFSANTIAPNKRDEKEFKTRYEKVLAVNREKYCKPREKVVKNINEIMEEIDKAEKILDMKKEEYKQKNKEEKR
jgi:hypothetical protein